MYFADEKVARVEKLDAPEATQGIETGLPDVERAEEETSRPADSDGEEKDRPPEPEAPRPDEG